MIEEQVEVKEAQPTDEQASAFLQGKPMVEPQKQAPAPEAEQVPAPVAETKPIEKTETQLLKEELNRLKSEFGQLRKRGMESPKPVQTPQVPQSWAKLGADEQAQLRELVKASLQGDEDWAGLQESRKAVAEMQERQQVTAQIQTVEERVRGYAGDLHKQLDPIMGRMYDEFKAKAEEGDDEAQELLWEIKNTRSGAKYLVDLAKSEYSQTIAGKGEQAKASQQAQAKKASVTLGTTQANQATPSVMDNLPDNPEEAAKILRKELVRRGAL